MGSKSWGQAKLRGRLPGWIRQPASVAVPFGVCEQVMGLEGNRERARRYQELARFKALSGTCWNAPAISQGRIYARSIKEGVCLDVSVPPPPPLRLLAPTRQPDGGLQFRLENHDGSAVAPERLGRLEILGSTSLAGWTAVSNAVVSPDVTVRVPPADGAAPSQVFYRVREPQ